MKTSTPKKVAFYLLACTQLTASLYSAHMYKECKVEPQKGRAAFERLSSQRLWRADPLDTSLFLQEHQKRDLVLGFARRYMQDYLVDDIGLMIVHYIAYKQPYTKPKLEAVKKGGMILNKFLGKVHVCGDKLPPWMRSKIPVDAMRVRSTDRVHRRFIYYYRLDDVLDYLLQNRQFSPRSCLCIFYCFFCRWDCGRKTKTQQLCTYEEALEAGWEDRHFLHIEKRLEESLHDLGKDHELKEITQFYLESYSSACVLSSQEDHFRKD